LVSSFGYLGVPRYVSSQFTQQLIHEDVSHKFGCYVHYGIIENYEKK
jgi:hypothetical protein